ncbi:hypothetical protein [Lentzea sp.]|uniref:hypothetical protein n=1 Tax=Lentzea sp. TaxID=56099 RepID=UPI002ED68BEA
MVEHVARVCGATASVLRSHYSAAAGRHLAMKVCGDAAFRRDLGIERRFRDARAAAAVEPTADVLLDSVVAQAASGRK